MTPSGIDNQLAPPPPVGCKCDNESIIQSFNQAGTSSHSLCPPNKQTDNRESRAPPRRRTHHPADQLLTSAIMSCATCSALFHPPSREWSTKGQLQLSVERMNLSSSSALCVLRRATAVPIESSRLHAAGGCTEFISIAAEVHSSIISIIVR